jgi:demethylmenaquinone methyltransferase/2-methoxy-6-polyprenyl-1,4-benzoquinol methylase
MDDRQIHRVKRSYRTLAPTYDDVARIPERLRPLAIARLGLMPGDTVLDLGCGTGLSFELLEQGVGPEGRVIGVELTPEMLRVAEKRAERNGWTNITFIEGNAEEVEIPGPVDAVMTFFTPHITVSRPAMERALEVLRPGGRMVASGARRAEGIRGFPVNLWYLLRFRAWRFVPVRHLFTRLLRGSQPYETLEGLLGSLEREDYLGGCTYIAYAEKRASVSPGSR